MNLSALPSSRHGTRLAYDSTGLVDRIDIVFVDVHPPMVSVGAPCNRCTLRHIRHQNSLVAMFPNSIHGSRTHRKVHPPFARTLILGVITGCHIRGTYSSIKAGIIQSLELETLDHPPLARTIPPTRTPGNKFTAHPGTPSQPSGWRSQSAGTPYDRSIEYTGPDRMSYGYLRRQHIWRNGAVRWLLQETTDGTNVGVDCVFFHTGMHVVV